MWNLSKFRIAGSVWMLAALSVHARPSWAQPEAPQTDALNWQAPKQGEFATALCLDATGTLWAGTEANGLWRRTATANWERVIVPELEPDETILALASDRAGRLWLGLARGGVLIGNGNTWRRFAPLQGLPSERVNDIAVNPADGSVWLATEAGLVRWSEPEGWRFFGAEQGLDALQFVALAFTPAGDLYAASACDGLWIASKADAYAAWRHVAGAELQPQSPVGEGLPSNLLNDVAVDTDGDIWVATVFGVARSTDGGQKWFYLRGKDWAINVEGSALNFRPKPAPTAVELLAEDWVTSLTPTPDGQMWLGFRQRGYERRNATSAEVEFSSADEPGGAPIFSQDGQGDYVRAIAPLGNGAAVIARFGGGVRLSTGGRQGVALPPATAPAPKLAALPSNIRLPSVDALTALAKRVRTSTDTLAPGTGRFQGMDWTTRGDWTGRYGDRYTRLFGMGSPFSRDFARDYNVRLREGVGPHQTIGGPYTYVSWMESTNPNVLYDPFLGKRRQAEMNDGGWNHEKYPFNWEGPDLWMQVTAGEGLYRFSLYFFNKDGQSGLNRFRDYSLHLKTSPAVDGDLKNQILDADETPDLARGRVRDFDSGGYAQFLLRGPGKFFIKTTRNRSHAVTVSGAFLDRIAGPASSDDARPMPWMGGERYVTDPTPALDADAIPELKTAFDLWAATEEAASKGTAANLLRTARLQAFRAAFTSGASPALLYNWRWKLGLWVPADREDFNAITAKAFLKLSEELARQKANKP